MLNAFRRHCGRHGGSPHVPPKLVCGSSRPASVGEHLISHALDGLSTRPRLHGLRVGVASDLMSLLQGGDAGRVAGLPDATGFWDPIAADPLSRAEWLVAIRAAPKGKENCYTVLSSRVVFSAVSCSRTWSDS